MWLDIFLLDTFYAKGTVDEVRSSLSKAYKEYLNIVFGKNYMSFPKSDVEHHCDPDGFPAKTRAKRHNIDMNDVISYLKSVYVKI